MTKTHKTDNALNFDGKNHPSVESHDFARLVRLLRKYLNTHTLNNGDLEKTHDAIKSFIITAEVEHVMTIGSGGYVIFSDNLDKKFGVHVLKDESVALTFYLSTLLEFY